MTCPEALVFHVTPEDAMDIQEYDVPATDEERFSVTGELEHTVSLLAKTAVAIGVGFTVMVYVA